MAFEPTSHQLTNRRPEPPGRQRASRCELSFTFSGENASPPRRQIRLTPSRRLQLGVPFVPSFAQAFDGLGLGRGEVARFCDVRRQVVELGRLIANFKQLVVAFADRPKRAIAPE